MEGWVGTSQHSWLSLGTVCSSLLWLLAACAVLGLARDMLAGKALWEGEGLSSRTGAQTCITCCADLLSGTGQQSHMAGEGHSAQGGSSHWTHRGLTGAKLFPPHPTWQCSEQGKTCMASRLSPVLALVLCPGYKWCLSQCDLGWSPVLKGQSSLVAFLRCFKL